MAKINFKPMASTRSPLDVARAYIAAGVAVSRKVA
jgi:hypothetical protein